MHVLQTTNRAADARLDGSSHRDGRCPRKARTPNVKHRDATPRATILVENLRVVKPATKKSSRRARILARNPRDRNHLELSVRCINPPRLPDLCELRHSRLVDDNRHDASVQPSVDVTGRHEQ